MTDEELIVALRMRSESELCQAAAARIEQSATDLTDPVTVHANMLRGTIARPTVEQIVHLYGRDALTKVLVGGLLETLKQEIGQPAPDPAAIREAALREAKPRIIPMHSQSMYGVCIGGRWDGWVMVKHPDGYWVSHNKPDPVDPSIPDFAAKGAAE